MKKLLMALICVIFIGVCAVMPVGAAGHTVSVNTTPAFRGYTVTFTATIGTDVEVSGGSVDVEFDENVLEYVSASWNLPGTTMIAQYKPSNSVGFFEYNTGVSETVSGTIFTIRFKVKDGAAFGESKVALNVELADKDKQNIAITNRAGAVIVQCNHEFTKQDIDNEYLHTPATCTEKAKYFYCCNICSEKGSTTFEYGTTLSHEYTKEDPQPKYLATEATCTSSATYYKCCINCGEKGTQTFSSGGFADHVYDREKISDDYKVSGANCEDPAIYNKSCKCGLKGSATFEYGSALGHTGGVATCTTQAVCDRCTEAYGAFKNHVYKNEKAEDKYLVHGATCQEPATYKKSCDCGKEGEATFTVGGTTEHVYDQKNTNEIYLVKPAGCSEGAIYVYSCKCGAKGTLTFEDAGASGHSYATSWSKDKNAHWLECTKCGDRKNEGAHVVGPAATEKDPQICTECLYILTPALGHTVHDYAKEWSSDANGHWYACSGCAERKDFRNHVFENACDSVCAECGYERGVIHTYNVKWSTDAEKHWNECTICGVTVNEGKHIAGPAATEYTSQKCTKCGYVIAPALDHDHEGGDVLISDEEGHWGECECGELTEKVPHEFDEGVVLTEPTATKNGEKLLTCKGCGYSKTESIEKLSASEKTNAAITTYDISNSGNTAKGCKGVGVVGLCALIIILVGAAGIVIVKKRL